MTHAGSQVKHCLRAFGALVLLVLATQAVSAQSDNIYEIRGSNDLDIYHINATTGVVTTLYNNYPGGSSATIAQRASDGMLFYAINATNGQVYRYNPATPTIAPVALTSTLGAAVPASFRMAFSPGGVLYYMPDSGVLYTINQVTGVATAGPTVTGIGSGGDMVFSSTGTLYVVNSNRQLYTAPLAGGAATLLGTITFPGGITPASLGLAFDGSGTLIVQTQSPSNMYDVNLSTLVASNATTVGGSTTSTGDLGSSAAPNPDLSITKTNGVSSVYQGGPVTYTIVATNNSVFPVSATIADTVSASVTGVTWTCAASAGSSCGAASGSGNTINTTATLAASGTATYTVSGTISASATGTLSNTATVAPPSFLSDANNANNSATDSDPINVRADLSISKTDGVATVIAGNTVTYTIVVRNLTGGTGASNGSIVTDTVPATISSVTWTCGSATGGATCGAASGSGNTINTTANLPVNSSVTYTVTGTLSSTATGTLTNTATVITPASGVSDPTDLSRTGAGNNSATDSDTITGIPSVTLFKSQSPSGSQIPGTDIAYTVTFTNNGGAAAQNFLIIDPNRQNTDPLERVFHNVDFKVGSVTSSFAGSGLTAVTVAYSNNGGTTWTYVPVSGGGGAPAGYDRSVNNIRWVGSPGTELEFAL